MSFDYMGAMKWNGEEVKRLEKVRLEQELKEGLDKIGKENTENNQGRIMEHIEAISCNSSWIECPGCGYTMIQIGRREKFDKSVTMGCNTLGCKHQDKQFTIELLTILLKVKQC